MFSCSANKQEIVKKDIAIMKSNENYLNNHSINVLSVPVFLHWLEGVSQSVLKAEILD